MDIQIIKGLILDMDFTEPLTEEAVLEMNEFIISHFKLAGLKAKPKYGKSFEEKEHILDETLEFKATGKEFNL